MMSTPKTRAAAFVTVGMVTIAALGVYGWLATSKVSTAAYLTILINIANLLGLAWNNFATGKVQQQVEHDIAPGLSAVQEQVEHSIAPQVSALVDATPEAVVGNGTSHDAGSGSASSHPPPGSS